MNYYYYYKCLLEHILVDIGFFGMRMMVDKQLIVAVVAEAVVDIVVIDVVVVAEVEVNS